MASSLVLCSLVLVSAACLSQVEVIAYGWWGLERQAASQWTLGLQRFPIQSTASIIVSRPYLFTRSRLKVC